MGFGVSAVIFDPGSYPYPVALSCIYDSERVRRDR